MKFFKGKDPLSTLITWEKTGVRRRPSSRLSLGCVSVAIQSFKARLDRSVDSIDQYKALITDLALDVEMLSVQYACQSLDKDPSVFLKLNLNAIVSEENRSNYLVTTIRLRVSEFFRNVAVHLSNCKTLYGARPVHTYAKAIGGDLRSILDKLWWLTNIATPVASTISYPNYAYTMFLKMKAITSC